MNGIYQEGDNLNAVWFANGGGDRVGFSGCAEIVVGKAAGPMGWYAVAQVMDEDGDLVRVHTLHQCETVVVFEPKEPPK